MKKNNYIIKNVFDDSALSLQACIEQYFITYFQNIITEQEVYYD